MSEEKVYVKRPPYSAVVLTKNPFNTVYGIPDNLHLTEKYGAAIKGCAFAGFNYGLFKTTIQEVPTLLASEKTYYYTARAFRSTLYGGFFGALYIAVVKSSSMFRGHKDDPLNHFFGGYALTSMGLLAGNWSWWLASGTIVGAVAAAMKSLFMSDFEFSRQPQRMTNCRYPEIYLFREKPQPDDMK